MNILYSSNTLLSVKQSWIRMTDDDQPSFMRILTPCTSSPVCFLLNLPDLHSKTLNSS